MDGFLGINILSKEGAVKHDNIWFVGDPHLGRRFETGVPLHRRGDREKQQLAQFREEVNTPNSHIVIVGDLFDHPHVGFHVVLEAFEILRDIDNDVIVMTGNHDEPRNLQIVSAIDMLEQLVAPLSHVTMVRRNPVQIGNVAYFPWDWTATAEEQVANLITQGNVDVVVGHWDLVSFGGDESHMAPTAALLKHLGKDIEIYSGHYHIEGDFEVDGVTVHCTGSMQPYTHGEDPNHEIYITFTLDELELTERDLANMCVRILLQEGEELPTDLNCLALTAKRVRDDVDLEDVEMGTFSWQEIIDEALEPLPPHVQIFITDKLKEYDID